MTFEEYLEELKKDEKNTEFVNILENIEKTNKEKEEENTKLKNEVEVLKKFFANVKNFESEEEKKKKEEKNDKKLFNEMLSNW